MLLLSGLVGMWELYWNNLSNNDGVKESRIILEF